MINCSPLDIRRGDYCAWFLCSARVREREFRVQEMDIHDDLRNCVYFVGKFCVRGSL